MRPALLTVQRISAPPQSSIALPVAHTLKEATIVVVSSGALAVTAQLSLVFLFNRLISGRKAGAQERWKTGYIAHHVVCILFMLFASTTGIIGWLSPTGATAGLRLGVIGASSSVRFLSATLLGMLLLWDLPCSILIPKLRNPVMFGHHVAMAITTILATLYLPMYYGFYYLGISEVSSIPLCVTELSSHVHDTIRMEEEGGVEGKVKRLDESAGAESAESRLARKLAAIREISQVLFALTFLWLRGYMFTRVTLGPFLSDMLVLLSPAGVASMSASAAAAVASKLVPLRMMLGLGLSFNLLQLFWAAMILKTALGMWHVRQVDQRT